MRIRLPFAGVFFLLCLIAGYAGLSSLQLGNVVDDKVLHALTFFVLTVVFYWIIDTNRRRTLNLTLVVCTLVGGVGSEFLQYFLPNDRDFDLYDIIANVIGSLAGLGLCSWYHKRMLERKRQRKGYDAVAGEDEELADLEAGEGPSGQEEGVIPASTATERTKTLEEEVDTWDENAVDAWDEGEDGDGDIGNAASANTSKGKGKDIEPNGMDASEGKKRAD